MLDSYWDAPQYTADTLNRLRTERFGIQTKIQGSKTAEQALFDAEQEIRNQLKLIQTQAMDLRRQRDEMTRDYERLSTIEIDFAEQIRVQEELAKLENRITELEERLRVLSAGRDF